MNRTQQVSGDPVPRLSVHDHIKQLRRVVEAALLAPQHGLLVCLTESFFVSKILSGRRDFRGGGRFHICLKPCDSKYMVNWADRESCAKGSKLVW
jgi:hypothetical protein